MAPGTLLIIFRRVAQNNGFFESNFCFIQTIARHNALYKKQSIEPMTNCRVEVQLITSLHRQSCMGVVTERGKLTSYSLCPPLFFDRLLKLHRCHYLCARLFDTTCNFRYSISNSNYIETLALLNPCCFIVRFENRGNLHVSRKT